LGNNEQTYVFSVLFGLLRVKKPPLIGIDVSLETLLFRDFLDSSCAISIDTLDEKAKNNERRSRRCHSAEVLEPQ
jgi:hypothetical protein